MKFVWLIYFAIVQLASISSVVLTILNRNCWVLLWKVFLVSSLIISLPTFCCNPFCFCIYNRQSAKHSKQHPSKVIHIFEEQKKLLFPTVYSLYMTLYLYYYHVDFHTLLQGSCLSFLFCLTYVRRAKPCRFYFSAQFK